MASKRISGITIEIGGDTTKLNKALSDVDRTLRTTSTSLRDINKLLQLNPGNADLLTQKQKALGTEIDATKQRLQELKNVEKDSVTPEQWDALQREIIETEGKLKTLEEEYKNFGSVSAQQIQAAGEKIKSVGEGISTFGNKVKDIGGSLTTHLSLPLAAVGAAGVKSFAEVDKTMTLTNQTMKNSESEAKMLSDAMKDAASNSTFGMKDAADATLNFARAGLDAQQAADTLAPAMNLAAGEGGNLDTVSAGLVATINGFHDSFGNAGQYADVFAAACNNSALDVDGLSNAMSIAAPIFSSAGYSVNDAALYMGVMANNGIDANKAATSLKTGMARLVSPAKQGAEMMDKLGISVTNADGSMKDSTQVQAELHGAFSQLSESEQIAAASAIFGKNQMAPWLALINTAPEDVEKLNGSLENCAGTTEEMANAMMSGFGGSLEKLKSSIDVASTSLGEALAPTISTIAEKIQQAVDWFNSLDSSQQQMIAKVGLVVAAIGPALAIAGTVISTIGGIVSAVGTVLSVGSTLIAGIGSVVVALGPIGVAIAAAVAAGVILYKNWDTIKEKATEIWNAVKETVSSAWDGIKSAISEKMEAIKSFISNAWNNIKTGVSNILNGIKSVVSSVWEGIKTTISTVLNAIKTVVSTVWKAYTTLIKTELEAIKKVVTTVWNAIKTVFTTVFNAIKTVVTTVWKGYTTFITSELNAIKTVVTTVWNAVKTVVTTVLNALKSGVQTAWNGIKEVVTSVGNAIKSTVTNAWNAIKTSVLNVVSNMKSSLQNKWNEIKQNVKNAFSASNFVELGKNIVSGIISGISKKASDLFTSLTNLAGDALKAAKKKLKSNSPSKLFRDEVGQWIPAGIAVGVEKNLGYVTSALNNMVDTMVPEVNAALSGSIPNSAMTGNTTTTNYGGVNINVYTQDGQSARDIAQEVSYILNTQIAQQRAVFA